MKKYTWTDNLDDELWCNGRFATVEECVADAVSQGREPGERIAVGICEDFEPHVDAGTLLERAEEDAFEYAGEAAEGWLDFVARKGYRDEDKLQEKLDKVFKEWLEETDQMPGFYHIAPLADMVSIPGKEG